MTLTIAHARAFAGFAVFGSAVASGYRGDWLLAGIALAAILLPAIWRARASWVAAWTDAAELLREVAEPGPPPAPPAPHRLERVTIPRPRAPGHPPWMTAEMPAIPVADLPGEGYAAGRHAKPRGLRGSVVYWVTRAARIPLP
jgi:hypothetical protein